MERNNETASLAFGGLLGGLGTGIITAKLTHGVSRTRVALVDLACLAGIASGAATASALRSADQPGASARATARWSLGGLLIGLGLGTYLTRHYDQHDDNAGVTTVARYIPAVAPTPGGLVAFWGGSLD
jgi:hypothetical protein